jgi:iron(III) transport system permease protein
VAEGRGDERPHAGVLTVTVTDERTPAVGEADSSRDQAGMPPRWRSELSRVLLVSAIGFVLFVVLFPLVTLVFESLYVDTDGGRALSLENWQAVTSDPRLTAAVGNTLVLAAVVTGISLPLGILLAWLLARTNLPARQGFERLLWITFFMPVLPITLGWILAFDPNFGLANSALDTLLGVKPFNIYSFEGIVFVHLVTRSITVKAVLLAPAFRSINSSMEEASRVAGRGLFGTVARVSVPMLFPIIAVVTLMSFLHQIESFEIIQVLGTPIGFDVYSTLIYQFVNREPVNLAAATVLGVIVLLFVLPLIAGQRIFGARADRTTVTGKQSTQLVDLKRWRWPAFAGFAMLGTFFVFVPLGLLIFGTFMRLFGFFDLADAYTLDNWTSVLTNDAFLLSLKNTMILGVTTSVIVVALCSWLAYVVVKVRTRGKAVLDFTTWAPLAMPGIVLAVGFLLLFLRIPFLRPFYGSLVPLVAISVLASLTLGTQLLRASLMQLDKELEEGSLVAGGSRAYTIRRVVLPLVAPALASVAVVSFAATVRDVAHLAILSSGSTQPLSILQLNYLADGSYEDASVVGVVVMVIVMLFAFPALKLAAKAGIRPG